MSLETHRKRSERSSAIHFFSSHRVSLLRKSFSEPWLRLSKQIWRQNKEQIRKPPEPVEDFVEKGSPLEKRTQTEENFGFRTNFLLDCVISLSFSFHFSFISFPFILFFYSRPFRCVRSEVAGAPRLGGAAPPEVLCSVNCLCDDWK